MEQKQRFVSLAGSGHFTVTELCREFEVSRKTGHKWLGRHAQGGMKALEERSRAPQAQRGLQGRARCADGPGTLQPRAGRGFKGWFETGDGKRCNPLTVTDLFSRFILKIEALPEARTAWTRAAFRALFRRQGLPDIIRVDNGAPFAPQGPGGLSKLSMWWIGRGIEVQFSRPACPQDNSCHERMHRTMKAECCTPPSVNGAAQQQRFDRWRKEFNDERLHEVLAMRVPADVYQPSARRLDERIKPRLYQVGAEIRRVDSAGFIVQGGGRGYVGESFIGVDVELQRSATSDLILVRYANVKLGHLDTTAKPRLLPRFSDKCWESKQDKPSVN